ncbi:unannotated protein [freshwater metagenome]|uniref:Unannotated protein n=1 Tax=freshwater metagenome TaxID=449393 RepID=A0A6J7CR24_9ZZZZ
MPTQTCVIGDSGLDVSFGGAQIRLSHLNLCEALVEFFLVRRQFDASIGEVHPS